MTDPALGDLKWHWGSAYDIHNPEAGLWIAVRRDTHETLRADDPAALRAQIIDDYTARPVRR